MKVLVISKPIYDVILPLVEFPQDGDNFSIEKSINSISSSGSVIALALGKYGMDVSFTGLVGEDETAKKIKDIFGNYKVDCSYLETNYEEKTCVSYKIYNSKSNKFTSINEIGLKSNLTKYKYDFEPAAIIMDDKDYNANLAALNNYPNALTIFIGNKFTRESNVYCNRCKYVLCSIEFASQATGVLNGLNKSKNIVSLFQKFIDLYSANLIIKLDNFDFLYCVDNEVRLIKNVNKNLYNKDNIYYSVLCYFILNGLDIENAIKFTNKAMLSSLNEVNLLNDFPEYEIVSKLCEDYVNLSKNNINNIDNNKIVNNNNISNIQNSQNLNNTNNVISNSESINKNQYNNVIANAKNVNQNNVQLQENYQNITANTQENINLVNTTNETINNQNAMQNELSKMNLDNDNQNGVNNA